ncbi:MAG: hypothetical protein JW932_00030 [Deltaproteobacteria bacterium]|nr:hypothetical protein [Deltaproteobacteria bacterium]
MSLINQTDNKLRCRHCHLTIDETELGRGCCPECLEVHGIRRRDFETLEQENDGKVRYRCDDCGAIIEIP